MAADRASRSSSGAIARSHCIARSPSQDRIARRAHRFGSPNPERLGQGRDCASPQLIILLSGTPSIATRRSLTEDLPIRGSTIWSSTSGTPSRRRTSTGVGFTHSIRRRPRTGVRDRASWVVRQAKSTGLHGALSPPTDHRSRQRLMWRRPRRRSPGSPTRRSFQGRHRRGARPIEEPHGRRTAGKILRCGIGTYGEPYTPSSAAPIIGCLHARLCGPRGDARHLRFRQSVHRPRRRQRELGNEEWWSTTNG